MIVEAPLQFNSVLILLLIVAMAVAVAAERLRVPYTVSLVLAGLLLGGLHVMNAPHLTKELLFSVFLPGLVFEAAFHLEYQDFRRHLMGTLALAVPGVAASIALTALILVLASPALGAAGSFTWGPALVFGSLIAATDPIAVVALFRSLGAPQRLSALLEGESLLNDGTSIVIFGLIVGGATATVAGVAAGFFGTVGIGAAVGLVIGLVVSKLTAQIDHPMIEITLTTIAAYGSFIAGEQLHGSGVIATVVAGMLCGNYGARIGMTPSTRVAVETFWEYIAFALNSLIFLLIGFESSIRDLLNAWWLILPAFIAVLAGRAIVVLAVTTALRRTRERTPASWSTVLIWGGLRGSLSMVLALSLPAGFPNRTLLVNTTFGVVLLSIMVQGLTMAPLLRRLGLARLRPSKVDYEIARGRLRAATAALDELRRMNREESLADELGASVRAEYEELARGADAKIKSLHLSEAALREEEEVAARRHLLTVEKERLIEMRQQGLLGREACDRVMADVDARMMALDSPKPRV